MFFNVVCERVFQTVAHENFQQMMIPEYHVFNFVMRKCNSDFVIRFVYVQ